MEVTLKEAGQNLVVRNLVVNLVVEFSGQRAPG
jgi:hypothetical protein